MIVADIPRSLLVEIHRTCVSIGSIATVLELLRHNRITTARSTASTAARIQQTTPMPPKAVVVAIAAVIVDVTVDSTVVVAVTVFVLVTGTATVVVTVVVIGIVTVVVLVTVKVVSDGV